MAEEKQEWKQAEEADDALLTADDLVTEVIPINGKPSLTHVGLAKIANERGISVTKLKHEVVDTETDKGILVYGSGKNREGDIRHACHFEPRSKPGGRELPQFDWAKAWSKFQRNLFKMFLYGDELVEETLDAWEANKGKGKQQPKSEHQIPPIEQVKNACRTAADAEETKKIMTELGLTEEERQIKFHEGAQALWGPDNKWDINTWEKYRKQIILFRKREGELYQKLHEIHASETETKTESKPPF